MHPILFVQIYLFLVLRTSVLMSYEYYNLGWNVHVHCTAHITQKHRQGRLGINAVISRYVVFGMCNIKQKWFQTL